MGLPDLSTYGLADLVFHEGDSASSVPFKELPGREWVLTASDIRVTGEIKDEGPKKFQLRHLFSGTLLFHGDVRPTKSGFDLALTFRRGRNTLLFEFETGDGEPQVLELDIFFKGTVRNWIEPFVKIAIFFVLIQTFVIKAFFIPTGSMEDTFFPGDYILVDRVSHLFDPPRSGDIIVFQYPKNFTQDFIKRLIGMPGDELRMFNKVLYRDDVRVDEPYVVNKDYRRFGHGLFGRRDNWGPLRIKAEHYFMMGDNRDFSKDSRFWGQLPAWRVKGRAWLRYMPLRRFGFLQHGRHLKKKQSTAES